MADYLSLPTTSPTLRSRGSSPVPSPPLPSASSSYLPAAPFRTLRRKDSLSTRPTREGVSGFLHRLPRRRKVWSLIGFVALVFVFVLRLQSVRGLLLLARFKLSDRTYEEGWFRGCGMRKQPLIFVRGDTEAAVVWEMSCAGAMYLEFGSSPSKQTRNWWKSNTGQVTKSTAYQSQLKGSTNRFAYSVNLMDLQGGNHYSYRILDDTGKIFATHTLLWHSSSTTSPDRFTIMAIADNQYNLRVFHRVLLSLLRYSSRYLKTTPSLILHAGDATQNPHNLPQWQTDFFDPLTSLLPLPLGQSTPIIQARGNHDWDQHGANVYSGGSPPRRDWQTYTGEALRINHPGTYFAFSPHERARIIVLDSNLAEEDQVEQENWLTWELGRMEWRRASLKIVMVHVPPFLEFWDREAWASGESQWSIFVRHRLTPLLSLHSATLVISGHQHAYSRGFLPTALHRSFSSSTNSSSLQPLAIASVRERGWEKAPLEQNEEGTIYTIIGGAGGTLDEDKVEDWGFYEKSLRGSYFGVLMRMEFGSRAGGGTYGAKTRVYPVARKGLCEEGRKVRDTLQWDVIGLQGQVLDKFVIEAEACSQ